FGEAVFTTSMTGYQEVATDPSFEGQIVCFTAPMVGNYGVAESRSESRRAHATAIVMREARGPEWTDWLHEHGLVGLSGVDTRSLVLHLREQGAMRAAAVTGDTDIEETLTAVRARPGMKGAALVAGVSTRERYTFAADGAVRVAVVDFGRGRGRRRVPARRRRRHACRLRRRRALAGAGRPRAAARRGANAALAARPYAGARRLPRSPAARDGDRQGNLQAAVRPSRCEPPGARPPKQHRARHFAEPWLRRGGGRRDRRHAQLALRRNGRRARLPRASCALRAVPSRGIAGSARRGADHRRLRRGAEGRCLDATTSSRSA